MKGVQKYDCVNMRKGAGAFYFPVRAFSISRTDCLGAQCNSLRFSFLRYNLKKKFAGQPLTSLLYDLNCFRMLFGISTIVFYIFILVSYFRSEHACFTKYSMKIGK